MRTTATFSLAALLVLPSLSCAQASRARNEPRRTSTARPNEAKRAAAPHRDDDADDGANRLESVTWNSVKHELTWVISRGGKAKDGAGFETRPSANYLIRMDEATMTVGAETRRFSREEASNVHLLMDLIAKYAVDSTLWWDDGQGEPVDGKGLEKKRPNKPRAPERPDNIRVLHVAYHHRAASN